MANILSSYTSFFELSVAFNFAYVSSQGLRDTIKSGFLHKIRHLRQESEDLINSVESKLEIIEEEVISQSKKESFLKEVANLKDQIEDIHKSLDEEIESVQSIIASESKTLYIVTGIYGIFILYFAGKNTFPFIEIIILTLLLFIAYFFSLRIKESLYIVTFFIIGTFLFTIFFPPENELNTVAQYIGFDGLQIFQDKNSSEYFLLYVTLLLSFFPFLWVYLRLIFKDITIMLSYYHNYRSDLKELQNKIQEYSSTVNQLEEYNQLKNQLKEKDLVR